MKSLDFVVRRNDLQQCKFVEMSLPDAAALLDDALLVKIDRFGTHPVARRIGGARRIFHGVSTTLRALAHPAARGCGKITRKSGARLSQRHCERSEAIHSFFPL